MLDLSSALELLLKRLKVVGLPEDVIDLIVVWQKKSYNYASVEGQNSVLFDSLVVTVSISSNTNGANPPPRALHISEGQTEIVAEKL